MDFRPAKPQVPNLIKNAQQTFQQIKHGIPNPAASQASRQRAQTFLNNIKKTPFSSSPAGRAFERYIQRQLANGQGLDDFEDQLKARGKQELNRQRHRIAVLSQLIGVVRAGNSPMRLRKEVIEPAKKRQLNGKETWERVSSIVKVPGPFPFLTWVESKVGPMTVGIGMKIQAGLAVGGSWYDGVSGLRHCMACTSVQGSIGVGAIAGADMAIQISLAPGLPTDGWSFTFEVDIGGGAGATGEVAISFKPTIHDPDASSTDVDKGQLFDYAFDSVALSVGGGGGLDLSIAAGLTNTTVLYPPPTE